MTMSLPKVISEGKIKLDDHTEITVCVLDNGQRIIPEKDMMTALKFLGLSEDEINTLLGTKPNGQCNETSK